MYSKKTLQELTIKDNFLFGAVMCDENRCRELIELVLQVPIEKVVVSKEHTMIYHPQYKGVRLDAYARDEHHTCYNVEMQAVSQVALSKRARYYHSQIDMELLSSGEVYENLPKTYVIFICDFDPFGAFKYRYTLTTRCKEVEHLNVGDDRYTIFLSTKGNNPEDESSSLIKFLEYVHADLEDSTKDFGDLFVSKIQESVRHVKSSREMEEHFMTLKELIRVERTEAREEGRLEGQLEMLVSMLEDLSGHKGEIPTELSEQIAAQKDTTVLKGWVKLAATVDSIEQFMKNM